MKKAFTMLELVFVIVIIGILAAAIIPTTRTNSLQEAAIQVVSHIRYTQHLAMVDDKFDMNDNSWYRKRWQLVFGTSGNTEGMVAYTIFSDTATSTTASNPNHTFDEIAIDPSNPSKFLTGGYSGGLQTSDSRANKKMNIGLSYGITSEVFSGGCSAGNKRISFDHLGRPIEDPLHSYTSAYKLTGLIQTTCILTLNSPDGSVEIHIEPETGYAHIEQI